MHDDDFDQEKHNLEIYAVEEKPWWQSRTVWLAIVTILLGALQAAEGVVTDPRLLGMVVAAVGFLTLVLRVLTTSEIKR